eukprot:2575092-Amphidinium_carterae.1
MCARRTEKVHMERPKMELPVKALHGAPQKSVHRLEARAGYEPESWTLLLLEADCGAVATSTTGVHRYP